MGNTAVKIKIDNICDCCRRNEISHVGFDCEDCEMERFIADMDSFCEDVRQRAQDRAELILRGEDDV